MVDAISLRQQEILEEMRSLPLLRRLPAEVKLQVAPLIKKIL